METTTIADRIRARLDALGKNASAVALEAGLSRSSVLDILKGKAANPRLDTLQKLTGPLQCSLQYLTGASESPGATDRLTPAEYALLDVTLAEDALELAVGVYREARAQSRVEVPMTVVYRDPAHPDRSVGLAVMNDDSLAAIGIYRGDQLTYLFAGFGDFDIPLVHGSIVITRRVIGGSATEYSARQVNIEDGTVRLFLRPLEKQPQPIEILSATTGEDDNMVFRNSYLTNPDGGVDIEGIAVRIMRPLPTEL